MILCTAVLCPCRTSKCFLIEIGAIRSSSPKIQTTNRPRNESIIQTSLLDGIIPTTKEFTKCTTPQETVLRRFPIRQIKIQFRFLTTIFDNHKELSDRNSSNLNTGISEKQIFITNDYTICIHSFNKETSNSPISPSINPVACAMSFIGSPIRRRLRAVERIPHFSPFLKGSEIG